MESSLRVLCPCPFSRTAGGRALRSGPIVRPAWRMRNSEIPRTAESASNVSAGPLSGRLAGRPLDHGACNRTGACHVPLLHDACRPRETGEMPHETACCPRHLQVAVGRGPNARQPESSCSGPGSIRTSTT